MFPAAAKARALTNITIWTSVCLTLGRVVYEMGGGRQLQEKIFPQDEDYGNMEESVKDVINFILNFLSRS